MRETKTEWYFIPASWGIAFLGGFQVYRIYRSQQADTPRQHAAVAAFGPWRQTVLAALPLKALSRFFGWFNELTLPMWLREPGYRFYSLVFGCNLSEIANSDLKSYPNLGAFFTRALKPGTRPIEPVPVVSPSDGRVLHFGLVQDRLLEQVKGFTYDLDDFLGTKHPAALEEPFKQAKVTHASNVADEEEFAKMNGITYSLGSLLGAETADSADSSGHPKSGSKRDSDGSKSDSKGDSKSHVIAHPTLSPHNRLFFCVVYLGPGDYHRFHSPANWVVETRRHVAGELYSVSPYMLQRLQNLFVLNERVALLGRWQHGFFAMVAVGATNVGSIKINFDNDLKTNLKSRLKSSRTSHTVSYQSASRKLRGVALHAGDELGMFRLGSTVVLVFEAPQTFRFTLAPGQRILYGQALGTLE